MKAVGRWPIRRARPYTRSEVVLDLERTSSSEKPKMKQDPKMKQPSPISRTQCQLRVDGIVNPRISFRLSFDEPDDFDIVLDDAFLGPLVITTDCILEIRGMGADWRTCTLDELKSMVVNDSESLVADDFPSASEIMEKRIVD